MKQILLIALFGISVSTLQGQRINLVAGGPGDGKAATNADITPWDIAVGQDGSIYIASPMFFSVRKIDPVTGIVSRAVGTGANGTGTTDALNTPISVNTRVAISPAGRLYYDEVYKIRMVNAAGQIVLVAGGGPLGFAGDGGLAINASFSTVADFCLDATGNMYVADYGNGRIRKIDGTTGIVTTIAGNGPGTLSIDGGLAINSGVSPQRLALDGNGNLFFSETSSHTIRKINLSTGIIDRFAGIGSFGLSGDGGPATSAALNTPVDIAIDGDKMYIADQQNGRVRQVMISTGIISTIAGTTSGFSGDGGPATSAQLQLPIALAFDASNNLIIAEFNKRIRKITGTTITTIGGNASFGGDGGPADLSSVNSPTGIIQAQNGDIFFSDELNNRIRKVDHATGFISTFAGTGVGGYSGEGGQASTAMLNRPHGLAFDGSGNIIFCDQSNARIRKINIVTGIITTIAGNGLLGDTGNGGLAVNAQLTSPLGIVIDAAGNIIFSDGSHKIKKVDRNTNILTTLAGTGTANFGGDGGPAISAQLSYPDGLAIDANGNLYVADRSNFRVRKIDATGTITTVAGVGNNGNLSDGMLATEAMIGGTTAVTFDLNGDLLLNGTYQLLRIDKVTGKIYNVAGRGGGGYTGDGGAAKDATLQAVGGIALGVDNNIYFTDPETHTVRKIIPGAPQTITFNTPVAHTFGDAPFALTASSSASLPVTFVSSNPAIASVSANIITIHSAGTVDITASQAGNADYRSASVTKSIQINAKAQTITFGSLVAQSAETQLTLSATATSGLVVTYTSSNSEIASLSGNIVTLKNPGAVNITASQAGNGNYLPAPSVIQPLTVNAVTGVEETPIVSIYPNPAHDQIILDMGSTTGNKTEVAIFDALGQPVSEIVIADGSHHLDVSTWHAGIYIIRIKGSQGVTSRSFIKAQ